MKLRNLLLCGVCALSSTFALAQNQTFPFTLTTADGLPEQTSDAASAFSKWVSPTYTFDEPVSSFRLTVTHTSWQDAYNTSRDGGNGYIFFTMGEFYLYDAAGNQVELTADNFYGNATESPATGDGVIGNLCDGDESTHYHTMYKNTDEPRPIGQEYYLEITLPQPMQSFSFGFAKRSNNANIPCEIIVTKGGEDADPYADFGFQLGEKVTTIEPGGLYVFADEGVVYEDLTTWLATGKDPRYASPAGTDKYYRIRRTPNVDCIFEAVYADEGEFYLKSYLGGTYIYGANLTDGSIFIEQAASMATAAKFHLDEEGYLVCNNHYYATNSQETLVAYDAPRRVMSIYKASISNALLLKDLTDVIAAAEQALADNKEALAAVQDGEIAALETAIAEAKKITESNTAEEINAAKAEVESAAIDFLKLKMFLMLDWCSEVLDEDNFGTSFGQYPIADKAKIETLQEQLAVDVEARTFASLEDIQAYLAEKQKVIDEIHPIDSFTELPIHLIDANIFTKMEGLGNYIYTSPTLCLPEPIEQIFLTFVDTNNGDKTGGWPCTNWAHFTLRDAEGNTVDLTEENFYTNALEPGDDGIGYPGICDFNEDGTPNLTTYLHTLYSSKDLSTNYHYLRVTFPDPMNIFSFDIISRDNGRLVPIDMVIDTVPYTYSEPSTVTIRQQVTSLSDLDPDKYYIFYGNLEKVSAGKEGAFYAGLSFTYPTEPYKEGVFKVIPTDKEDTYKIHFVVEDIYLTQPDAWTGATSTGYLDDAGEFIFTESANLADAFKVYGGPIGDDEADVKYMLQDWGGSMGYYKINGEGFENDDTDGESDWFIYEVDPVAYHVYVIQISKLSQLNTDAEFAMYGNLGKVNPDAGTPGGYYRTITATGQTSTNLNLFKLENGANGTYKIHFIDDDLYLKAPTDWAGMATTENPAEAGEFVFVESENLAGAFKIYRPLDGKLYMLQDWGDSMGSYPIEGLENDDTDGESDWYLFTPGDPDEVELFRKDYVGEYVYKYDYHWDDHHIVEVPVVLEADPDSEDGVVINNFYDTGCPLKGVFDGVAHTITFAPMQEMNSDEKYTYVYRSTSSEEDPITFVIDLGKDKIVYYGQGGFIYRNNFFDPSLPEEDPSEYPDGNWKYYYWKQLSSTFIELVPVLIGDDWTQVERALADDAEVVSVSYFTVGGQAVSAPVKGVNIIRTVLSDGSVKTAKVLVK